jgi:hypothetical protein
MQMRQDMMQQNLDLRRVSLDERERHSREAEKAARDREEGRNARFNTKEGRLAAAQEIKQNTDVAKLALAQRALEHKIAAGDTTVTMKQWREINDAKRRAIQAEAQVYSVNNGMDDKQKAKLAKELDDAAEEEIRNMRNMQGSSTPTGGAQQPGGGKTDAKASERAKPIPTEIRSQFDKLPPDKKAAGIAKLKADGYQTEGL